MSGTETPNPARGRRDTADSKLYRRLFRTMVLIRRFEEAVSQLFLRNEIYGSTHLCTGEEAVCVGVTSVLGTEDRVACTYRGHGTALALGSDPGALMAEMLGRATGTCGGRAGSMNVVDVQKRLIGCFGIVGGSIGAATGAALAVGRRGGTAVAFFGDGAANQAYFHECLNFAKVFTLPVLFVCENNQYGEYTPTTAVTPGGIVARPTALGISAETIDGQDVWEVRRASTHALAQIRAGNGPCFIEACTYRYSDHGRGDPIKYRPEGEMERWRGRDPIEIARTRLLRDYGVSPEELDVIAASALEEVQHVSSTALTAPFPDLHSTGSEFAPTP